MAAELNPHIAVLFEFPTLNGGEHSMLSVLESLQTDCSLRFTAIAPPSGPLAERLSALRIPIAPLTIRAQGGSKRDTPELLSELSDILASIQPDVLHANSLSMSRLTGRGRGDLPVRCCTGHLRDIMKLSASTIRDMNHLDRIVAVSCATKDFHVAQGLSAERTDVVYNGVDTARFCRGDQASARQKLLPQLPPTARVILNVGQICLRKGQLDLAQAAVTLLSETEDLHLVLVGKRHSEKAESIAYEQAIVDAFESSGRTGHLHRPGYCENIEEWMNAADVLVHTARQEPLGRVLLEAAACELPIIATDVGGTSEILQHQHSASLIPPADQSSLQTVLQNALRNPAGNRTLATRAVERIHQTFRVPQAAARLHEFWLEALRHSFGGSIPDH